MCKINKKQTQFRSQSKENEESIQLSKSKYASWFKIKRKTCNVYNEITKNLNITEEEWQEEMNKLCFLIQKLLYFFNDYLSH